MKIIIRRSGAEMPHKIINNAVSIKENEHCIIVNTQKNRLMYSKPEFEWGALPEGVNGEEKQ